MRLKIVVCSVISALVIALGWICNQRIEQSKFQQLQENAYGAWQQEIGVHSAPRISFLPRNYVQIVSIPADK